ncbi:MAG TPA: UbiH/UbiF/VisC/COQ6 family ubiquinone biosynthesis hydroxylase [Steroidobacteraceae bacterium]|jgi:2-polyprenylphenol 6-hydroxylase|nr:UbiH/UbiF/VisC/COQ6 family ubiquinone biosynthesis hydroxylase [Steroidobacteraceae bacterium]
MRHDFHIVIVGGGMVGACAGALAAVDPRLAELRIAVLEAHPPAAPPQGDVDLRVSAVSRASQRILTAVGAWPLVPPQSLSPYEEMIVWDAASKPGGAGAIHFSASATSEPNLGHIVENRRLQWALYDCPPFRQRVTLLRAELAGLTLERDRAVVSLGDGRALSAALVVGSDGAASLSRKLAGIETAGWNYDQRALVTHVRTERPHARTAWQRFLADGPIAYLPLADGRSSIVWTTRPAHAEHLAACPPEQASQEIEQALDGVLGKVEVAAPRMHFPLRLTHARQYCKERFALVGDAAHSIHPLAGQGVNLGFLDCAALVQVLAQELADGGTVEALAELRVLRRYERWRKSENLIALGMVDGLNRLFSTSDETLGWIRRSGLGAVNRSALAKRFFIGRALGTAGELPRVARS